MQGVRQSTARQRTVEILFKTQKNENDLCTTRNRLGRADYEKLLLKARSDAMPYLPIHYI